MKSILKFCFEFITSVIKWGDGYIENYTKKNFSSFIQLRNGRAVKVYKGYKRTMGK